MPIKDLNVQEGCAKSNAIPKALLNLHLSLNLAKHGKTWPNTAEVIPDFID